MGKKKSRRAPAPTNNSSQPTSSKLKNNRLATSSAIEQCNVQSSSQGQDDRQHTSADGFDLLDSLDSKLGKQNCHTNVGRTTDYIDGPKMTNMQYSDKVQQRLSQYQQTTLDHYVSAQQSLHSPLTLPTMTTSAQQLNPLANDFQPALQGPSTGTKVQSKAPRRSARLSGRSPHGPTTDQVTQNAASAYSGGRFHKLRANGLLGASKLMRDIPFPSIEQQFRQSSNIPMAINSVPSLEAPKKSTSRFWSPTPTPLPVPRASDIYLAQASHPPTILAVPQRLLVILDLNGTLLKRTSRGHNFHPRPGVASLMQYLFANHTVMIYSSARPENVQRMVDRICSKHQRQKLAAVWGRDKLNLSPEQYDSKVQVYKNLEQIWHSQEIQKTAQTDCPWGQSNTILIDDSHMKAAAQPHNLLLVKEFLYDPPCPTDTVFRGANSVNIKKAMDTWTTQEQNVVKGLQVKLEELKWTEDVSRLIRHWQNDAGSDDNAKDEHLFSDAKAAKSMSLVVAEAVNVGPIIRDDEDDDEDDEDESDGGVDSTDIRIDESAKSSAGGLQGTSGQRTNQVKSVSPIGEDVFRDLLGITARGGD